MTTGDGAAVLHRRYLEAAGCTVHVVGAGASPAQVFCLHQISSSARSFEPLLAGLAGAGLPGLAMDLPGFGGSAPLAAPGIAGYADVAAALLRSDAVAAPAVLVGHHTGALVAAELAVRAPDLVRALVLLGIPFYPTPEARHARWAGKGIEVPVPAADGRHLLREWERLRHIGPSSPLEIVQAELADTLRAVDYHHAYAAAMTYDSGPALRRIACPTLVVAGSLDLPNQEAAAALLADGRLVSLDGGDAFFPTVHSDEVADLITQFLPDAPDASGHAPNAQTSDRP